MFLKSLEVSRNVRLGEVMLLSGFGDDPSGGVSRSEGTIDQTHRFTGQGLDPETGLYYYGGRYYDQEISRFVSPDPYVQEPDEPQNLNRYTYVLNNPQGYVDPNGHFWWIIEAVLVAVYVATESLWPGLLVGEAGLTTLGSMVFIGIITAGAAQQMAMLSSDLQKQAEIRPIASNQQSNIQQALRANESQPGIDFAGSEGLGDKDSWWARIADRIGGCPHGDDICSMGGTKQYVRWWFPRGIFRTPRAHFVSLKKLDTALSPRDLHHVMISATEQKRIVDDEQDHRELVRRLELSAAAVNAGNHSRTGSCQGAGSSLDTRVSDLCGYVGASRRVSGQHWFIQQLPGQPSQK